jgi:hypothetical protein
MGMALHRVIAAAVDHGSQFPESARVISFSHGAITNDDNIAPSILSLKGSHER